jgi:hypothetical protein
VVDDLVLERSQDLYETGSLLFGESITCKLQEPGSRASSNSAVTIRDSTSCRHLRIKGSM